MSRPTTVRRLAAAALAALIVGVTFVPVDADARAGRGGGFGSRGSKTFSAPPPTATSPGAAPIQRSQTPNAGVTQPGMAGTAQQARRPGLFGGGLGAGLMGGLLGAGLFGLLSGAGLFSGLGSLSSIVGLLLQGVLIFFVVKLALGWWRRRQQGATPAYQGATNAPRDGGYRFDAPPASSSQSQSKSGFGGSGFGFGSNAAAPAVAPLSLDKDDFDAFERLLGDVQAAWSGQDVQRLQSLATAEIVDEFSSEFAEDADRGVVNRTGAVKLLQGDLSEAWSEGARDYATVAMRYELTDVTIDKASGRVVDGDPERLVEATEIWTFVRSQNQSWQLSAIQQQA